MRVVGRIVAVVTLAAATVAFVATASLHAVVTAPPNQTVSNAPGQAGAVVTYPAPVLSGGDTSAICLPASGSFFSIGTTTVTCTGNTGSTAVFTVTVNDVEPPVITVPADFTVESPHGAAGTTVFFPAPVVSDNSGVVTTVCTPSSGSFFLIGTTLVTCTATDGTGNTATAVFRITVVEGAALPGDPGDSDEDHEASDRADHNVPLRFADGAVPVESTAHFTG